MLWLLLGALVALIAGGLIIKLLPKLALLGILAAVVGAFMAVGLGWWAFTDNSKNAAKCASIDGSFGGNTCFVDGIEKDLKEIHL